MAEKGIGWVSLDRQIENHWLWKDKPFSKGQAWIDLILSVNHTGKKILIDGETVYIPKGSFVTSLRKLADKWGWSINKVSRFLFLLENDSMLTQKRDTKKTVLSLENYGKYQDRKTQKRTGTEHRRNTTGSRTETNNNDNKSTTYSNNENKAAAPQTCPSGGNDYFDPDEEYYKNR